MFILNRQQVEFCRVVSSDVGKTEVSSAIAFNGSLFTKGETFLSSEKSKACKRVQELLEIPQQFVLLLEDKAEIALYHLNSQVERLETQEAFHSDKQGRSHTSSHADQEKGVFNKLRHRLHLSF